MAPAGEAAGRQARGRNGVSGRWQPHRCWRRCQRGAGAVAAGQGGGGGSTASRGAGEVATQRGGRRAHRLRGSEGKPEAGSSRLGSDRGGPAAAAWGGGRGTTATARFGDGEGAGRMGIASLRRGARGDAVAGGGGSPERRGGGEAARPTTGAWQTRLRLGFSLEMLTEGEGGEKGGSRGRLGCFYSRKGEETHWRLGWRRVRRGRPWQRRTGDEDAR